jgi:hypothetical protein
MRPPSSCREWEVESDANSENRPDIVQRMCRDTLKNYRKSKKFMGTMEAVSCEVACV